MLNMVVLAVAVGLVATAPVNAVAQQNDVPSAQCQRALREVIRNDFGCSDSPRCRSPRDRRMGAYHATAATLRGEFLSSSRLAAINERQAQLQQAQAHYEQVRRTSGETAPGTRQALEALRIAQNNLNKANRLYSINKRDLQDAEMALGVALGRRAALDAGAIELCPTSPALVGKILTVTGCEPGGASCVITSRNQDFADLPEARAADAFIAGVRPR